MKSILYSTASLIVGIAIGFLYIGTLPDTSLSQKAIIGEYLAIYCNPPNKNRMERWIGEAQLLSKISIKAGLGERALAEYALCKIKG